MKTIVITLFSALLTVSAMAQTPEMQFYLSGGVKSFSEKPFNNTISISPDFVPSIGAGLTWQRNGLQLGTEFLYLDGKKDTDDFGSILSGINANVLAGYQLISGPKFRLSAQSGFTYALHHLTVTDHNYSGSAHLNSTIYHNMVIAIPAVVMLQHVSSNGLFTGLRLSYTFAVGHNEWRYIEGANTEVYTSGADGFQAQLIFGGLLTLNKKKS